MANEKYLMSHVCCLIDETIMDCSLEVKLFGTKNLIDMTLINLTTFRMTLKATENRKNARTVYISIVTLRPPFRICIINSHIRWDIRARTMGKSIFDITTVDFVVINSSKGKHRRCTGLFTQLE